MVCNLHTAYKLPASAPMLNEKQSSVMLIDRITLGYIRAVGIDLLVVKKNSCHGCNLYTE